MSAPDLLSSVLSAGFLTELTLPGWGFLLLAFALMAIPMGPAEPTAVLAGAAAASVGLPLWLVGTVIAAGMLLGDLITFLWAGALRSRLLQTASARARLRRWESRLTSQPLWRDLAVAGLRFIPGTRTPTAVAARGSGISCTKFCLLTALGASAWALVWTSAASVMESLPTERLLLLLGVVVLLLLLGWRYRSLAGPASPQLRCPMDQHPR